MCLCVSVGITKQTAIADWLLGEFWKLRKTTISYVMSVRLPAWNNWAPTGWISNELDI
jgi:hypothetical protein